MNELSDTKSRIAEAKARAEKEVAYVKKGRYAFGTRSYPLAADVLFLADQLARAHAVIEAARYVWGWDCPCEMGEPCPVGGDFHRDHGILGRALADFDRGEQG